MSAGKTIRTVERQGLSTKERKAGIPIVQDDFLHTPKEEWLCWNRSRKFRRVDGAEYLIYPKEAPISTELIAYMINRLFTPDAGARGWKLVLSVTSFGNGKSKFCPGDPRELPATAEKVRQALGMAARTSGFTVPYPDDPSDQSHDWTPLIRDLLARSGIIIWRAEPADIFTDDSAVERLSTWRPKDKPDDQGFQRPVWDIQL
jgi:hypothetical protein